MEIENCSELTGETTGAFDMAGHIVDAVWAADDARTGQQVPTPNRAFVFNSEISSLLFQF